LDVSNRDYDRKLDAELTHQAISERCGSLDWIVVDHYQLDGEWESSLKHRGTTKFIMVIDDLADRIHDCELLLDQNYMLDYKTRYNHLVPEHCTRLLGPKYLLLRNEFLHAKTQVPTKTRAKVVRVLLFFGGADPTDETNKALSAIERYPEMENITFDVVVGSTNPQRAVVEERCSRLANVQYHCQISNIAQLMARADFSIGAGGVTMWERCYLGLPSAVIIAADNQIPGVEAAASIGAVWNLGWHETVEISDIADIISIAIKRPTELSRVRMAALQIFEGESGMGPGVTILETMAALSKELGCEQ
jgi:UDP-2,4-diacetamido-2,4,6-trideoxy-beta-L-altropyranose hydrolase